MGTTWFALIIHQTRNVEEFVPIIGTSSLPLRVLNINYSSEGIVFNIKLGGKICSFLVLCRPSSQSSDGSESFSKNLKRAIDRVTQNTPYMMVTFK